jgi:hypothetical protein
LPHSERIIKLTFKWKKEDLPRSLGLSVKICKKYVKIVKLYTNLWKYLS